MLKLSNYKPRQPDLTQPRYDKAQTAINITHELANKDVVYDQWPIDDPYRDTALCVVESMHGVGDPDLAVALEKLPQEKKNELIEVMATVIELRVPNINSAYDNVHVIDGVPKMTPAEQINTIATHAHMIARNWAHRQDEGLGTEERVMGAVHGILNMFQNGFNERVPAFQLIPIDPETDQGCINSVYRDNKPVGADWNYGTPMPLAFRSNLYGEDATSPHGSLTYRFEERYEQTRERYRTAAQDLFGG